MPAIGWEIFPNRVPGRSLPLARDRGVVTLVQILGGDRMRLVLQLIARLLVDRAPVPGRRDRLGHLRRLSQRRSGNRSFGRAGLAGAGSALLAGTPVAQQQNARTSAAGSRMAHHRNDEIDLAGRLHPVEPATEFEKPLCGQSKGIGRPPPALVRHDRHGHCSAITPRWPADQLAHHNRGRGDRRSPIPTPRSGSPGSTSWTISTSRS